jgi:F-type H+-transporting ATPase subunit gamma
MATVREIRARISTVKKIQQVTSAMKMVAAARLRRAQERAEAARPYAERMQEMLANLAPSLQGFDHPLLQKREVKNVGIVVLGAQGGLAGSYNANLMREVQNLVKSMSVPTHLIVRGKKAVGFLKRRHYNVVGEGMMPTNEVHLGDVRALAGRIRQDFESGEVDEVYLVYSQFLSAMSQRPSVLKLLPLEPPETEEGAVVSKDILFEPNPEELLSRLLPRYVDVQVYRGMTEAVASEFGARMTSMTSASDNASEMIKALTLIYNRARQAAITKELAEIVGGAEALQQG